MPKAQRAVTGEGRAPRRPQWSVAAAETIWPSSMKSEPDQGTVRWIVTPANALPTPKVGATVVMART